MYIIVTEWADFIRVNEITEQSQKDFEEGFIDIINTKDFTYLTDDGWKEIPYATQDNPDSGRVQ